MSIRSVHFSCGGCAQSRASGLPAVIPFEGLELGPLLGKGGYGRVYRGIYCGRRVAVKVRHLHARLRAASACTHVHACVLHACQPGCWEPSPPTIPRLPAFSLGP